MGRAARGSSRHPVPPSAGFKSGRRSAPPRTTWIFSGDYCRASLSISPESRFGVGWADFDCSRLTDIDDSRSTNRRASPLAFASALARPRASPPSRPIIAMWSRSRLTTTPPFRPATRASSRDHSCAVPFAWAARPPLLAISFWRCGSIDANPRLLFPLIALSSSDTCPSECTDPPCTDALRVGVERRRAAIGGVEANEELQALSNSRVPCSSVTLLVCIAWQLCRAQRREIVQCAVAFKLQPLMSSLSDAPHK